MSDHPLTVDEVRALTPGHAVEVVWSGGNGPHHYIVTEFAGELYAGDHRNDNPLTGPGAFVGQEHYHTRVWALASASSISAPLDEERLAAALHNVITLGEDVAGDFETLPSDWRTYASAIAVEYARLATTEPSDPT